MAWFKKEATKPPGVGQLVTTETAVTAAPTDVALGGFLSLVVRPHLSEKAVRLQSLNQYSVAVVPGATKTELKKQLEKLYGVHVLKITSVKLPGKIVSQRGKSGRRAVRRYFRIKLKPGEAIDLNKVKS